MDEETPVTQHRQPISHLEIEFDIPHPEPKTRDSPQKNKNVTPF